MSVDEFQVTYIKSIEEPTETPLLTCFCLKIYWNAYWAKIYKQRTGKTLKCRSKRPVFTNGSRWIADEDVLSDHTLREEGRVSGL